MSKGLGSNLISNDYKPYESLLKRLDYNQPIEREQNNNVTWRDTEACSHRNFNTSEIIPSEYSNNCEDSIEKHRNEKYQK